MQSIPIIAKTSLDTPICITEAKLPLERSRSLDLFDFKVETPTLIQNNEKLSIISNYNLSPRLTSNTGNTLHNVNKQAQLSINHLKHFNNNTVKTVKNSNNQSNTFSNNKSEHISTKPAITPKQTNNKTVTKFRKHKKSKTVKIFISGVCPHMSNSKLIAQFLEKAASIKDFPANAKITYCKVSPGFAFMHLMNITEGHITNNLNELKMNFGDRILEIRLAVDTKKYNQDKILKKDRKILVNNLKDKVVSINQREYFEKYGEIENAYVAQSTVDNKSKGFGFVQFKSEASVNKVLKEKWHNIKGSWCHVKKNLTMEEIKALETQKDPKGNEDMEIVETKQYEPLNVKKNETTVDDNREEYNCNYDDSYYDMNNDSYYYYDHNYTDTYQYDPQYYNNNYYNDQYQYSQGYHQYQPQPHPQQDYYHYQQDNYVHQYTHTNNYYYYGTPQEQNYNNYYYGQGYDNNNMNYKGNERRYE